MSLRVSDRAPRSALAGSLWARARVAELEPEYAVHRAEILRLGRSFRIVTRETSLIVLETLQDYVRFEVEPPRELAADYERTRQAMGRAGVPDPQQKIERTSQDFSGGYGPEEYSLRKARPGKYQIVVHFASERQQVVGGGSTHAHLRVYTRFGTGEQAERSYSVQLPRAGASVRIAEIDMAGKLEED